jgi:DNA-binding transcriptional ArsR family regulator
VTAPVIETFAALADPNRFRMVELLRSGPRTVNEISGRLALNQPLVSKHLRTLREAGLVDVEPRAQKRHYELRADSLRQLQRWLDRYRQLWEARFDRLDTLVEELTEQQTAKEKRTHARKRTP